MSFRKEQEHIKMARREIASLYMNILEDLQNHSDELSSFSNTLRGRIFDDEKKTIWAMQRILQEAIMRIEETL